MGYTILTYINEDKGDASGFFGMGQSRVMQPQLDIPSSVVNVLDIGQEIELTIQSRS
jgi:hypothetical protein